MNSTLKMTWGKWTICLGRHRGNGKESVVPLFAREGDENGYGHFIGWAEYARPGSWNIHPTLWHDGFFPDSHIVGSIGAKGLKTIELKLGQHFPDGF